MPVAAVGGPLFAAEKSAGRPNIVFVFADQIRAQAMGCMGNRQVITPNLNNLAKEGLLLTNAISCAPVCSQYRAQLMAGRYPHSTGVIHNDIRLPDNEIVISQIIKNQDYRTGYIGKRHPAGYRKDPVDAKGRRGWDFWAVRNCSQGQRHRRKQRPWEESINIPFIVRYPRKIKKGQVRDWTVSSVDVMPMLLGLCGVSIPSQVEGMDYSSTFFGKSIRERNAAFLFNVHRGDSGSGIDWRGIRTKEWTYAYHFSCEWVLYNLKKNPHQLDNLVDDPKFAGKKKELHQQLENLRKELGEPRPLKGRMPVPIQRPD